MIDEGKLSQAAAKGSRASALIENDILSEAFKALERSYIEAWRATKIHDVADREKLFLAINVVGKVKEHLESVINNGKLAAADLKELAETAERKKRFGII